MSENEEKNNRKLSALMSSSSSSSRILSKDRIITAIFLTLLSRLKHFIIYFVNSKNSLKSFAPEILTFLKVSEDIGGAVFWITGDRLVSCKNSKNALKQIHSLLFTISILPNLDKLVYHDLYSNLCNKNRVDIFIDELLNLSTNKQGWSLRK